MARNRDVAAFGERAQRYDERRLGELHHLAARPAPWTRAATRGCAAAGCLMRLLDLAGAHSSRVKSMANRSAQAASIWASSSWCAGWFQ